MNRIMALFFCVALAMVTARAGMIEPALLEQMTAVDSDEKIEVMVVLAEQLDGERIIRTIKDKAVRRSHTISALKELSERTQAGLLAELEGQRLAGRVGRVTPFWIVNAVYCEVTPDLVYSLAGRSEVAAVQWNTIITPDPLAVLPGTAAQDATTVAGSVEWHVTKVKADSVWTRYNITGDGVIVGNIDTGVDYTHPDLVARMWRDPNYPKHGWNYDQDNDDPMDGQGHGTHTAGTHSGDGSGGIATGVAPGSSVMAVKVKTSVNEIAENSIFSGIQFCLAPPLSPDNHAHLLSMSLGYLLSWNPRQVLWRHLVTNVAATGLPFFIAAGNEATSGLRCPGNVPSPWHHPADQPGGLGGSISIGATDVNDNIASFSSRGPVTWQSVDPFFDYPNPPGLIKPDFSAPGQDVNSTRRGGGYTKMSGTSMATPGAAGVAALMLEKNPYLLPEQVNEIMENSVVPMGEQPKNNTFGTGRICAMRAVENTPPMGHDVAVQSVLAPAERIDNRVPLAPTVVVWNRGMYHEPSVPVHCRVDSSGVEVYRQTKMLALEIGERDTVVFQNWNVGPGGNSYNVTFWHSMASDTNRWNDTLSITTVTRIRDVKTVRTNLSRRVRADAAIRPTVTLRSADHTERDFGLWLQVDSAGTTVYLDSVRVDSVPKLAGRTFSFAREFNVGQPDQVYDVRAWHDCPNDESRGNDTLVSSFEAVELIRVLWLHSDYGPPDTTIGVHLEALGDSIDYFDVRLATPALSDLSRYNVVGVHSNFAFADPTALGDVLADYVDAGGAVVLGNFSFISNHGLAGRIMTGDYATIDKGVNTHRATRLGWRLPRHRLMLGIGEVGEYYAADGSFNVAAESVASWDDGRPYVAVSRNRLVVGVNSYPGIYEYPERTGDWALVFFNALHFAASYAVGIAEDFDPFRPALHVELDAVPSVARRSVTVNYLLPSGREYSLGIYGINGRLVRTLGQGTASAGLQRVSWDVTDTQGRRAASGVYFCRLTVGERTETRKLVVE